MEANDELEVAYAEGKGEDGEHDSKEDVSADIKKTEEECEKKMEEVEGIVQHVLWSNFGNYELSLVTKAAEDECERFSLAKDELKLEAYDFMLGNLERLSKEAKEAISKWNRWIPEEERRDFQKRIGSVETRQLELVSRKAQLIQTQAQQRRVPEGATCAQVPAIKLRPTALPKFDGKKRNFYLWKKDWEALQKQGEPTGSKEVKKFQLLDSLEERVAKDLRLSNYESTDEIFRILGNRW